MGWGWVHAAPMHAHAHTHVEHDKHGYLHGGGHLQFLNMFILAFHACAFSARFLPFLGPLDALKNYKTIFFL